MWSGRHGVLAAAELGDAVDLHHVGADALDRRAHLVEHAREVLHVRLAGGVADDRRAGGRGGGHQRVLGAHHGRLVHEEVARAAGRRRGALMPMSRPCSTVAPSARKASRCGSSRRRPITSPPGGGITRRAEARQQRAGDQERGADPLGERGVDVGLVDVRGAQRDGVVARGARPSTPRSASSSSSASMSRIRGTLCRITSLVGEQRAREQRQRGVLVAGGHDGAGQRHAAFDHELLHEGRRARLPSSLCTPCP